MSYSEVRNGNCCWCGDDADGDDLKHYDSVGWLCCECYKDVVSEYGVDPSEAEYRRETL